MKKDTLENIGIVTVIGGYVGLLVFSPILVFGFAYLGGIILKMFVGDLIVNGMNLIFNTTRFTTELIPVACATLATIGKYFKSTNINNNK